MSDRWLRYAAALLIAAFFALMWGMLLRRHLPIGVTPTMAPRYGDLLAQGETERTSLWGVYLGTARIGTAETTVKRQTDGTFSIRTDTKAELTPALRYLTGMVGTLDVDFTAAVSPLRGLLHFTADSQLLDMRLQGTVKDEELLVVGRVGGQQIRTSLPYDKDRLLGQVLSPLAALPELSEASVGRSWTIQMVNPLAGNVQDVAARVAEMRKLDLDGQAERVYKLTFTAGTNRWACWTTEDGEVIAQGTPIGLTLRREDVPARAIGALTLDVPTAPVEPQN